MRLRSPYALSTHSAVANSTSSMPLHGARGLLSSVLNDPLIVSAKALSQLDPTDPTEAAIPASERRSDKAIEVYWLPLLSFTVWGG